MESFDSDICGAANCNEHSTSTCSGCNHKRYCSRSCQIADWQSHKQECKSIQDLEKIHKLNSTHFDKLYKIRGKFSDCVLMDFIIIFKFHDKHFALNQLKQIIPKKYFVDSNDIADMVNEELSYINIETGERVSNIFTKSLIDESKCLHCSNLFEQCRCTNSTRDVISSMLITSILPKMEDCKKSEKTPKDQMLENRLHKTVIELMCGIPVSKKM
jgi:hypothetical protein